MKQLIGTVLLLGLAAGIANAEIPIGEGMYFKAYLSDPVSVGDGSEGLVSYTLYFENISGNDAYNPTVAVGIGTVGTNTGVLVAGELHNEQFISGPTQLASPYQNQSSNSSVDTHWLFDSDDASLVIAQAPSEEVVDGAGSAEYGDWGAYNSITGYSTHLSGGLGLDFGGSTPPAVLAVAQIIVPECSQFTIYAQAGASGQTDNFTAMIPEPASLSLLALGGLALLRRRES